MRYFIFILSFVFLFPACSSDDNPTSEPPEEPGEEIPGLTLEEYYDLYCYGYKVKDTTNLDVYSRTPIEDGMLLAGLRNGYLWIGEFDLDSKEQINEYLDKEKLKLNQKLTIEYGEEIDLHINMIRVEEMYKKNNYTLFSLELYDNNDSRTRNFKTFYYHSANYTKKPQYKPPTMSSTHPHIINWHDNSILLYLDLDDIFNENDIYSCIQENGEITYSGYISYAFLDSKRWLFPFDYNFYIGIYTYYEYEQMRYTFSILQLQQMDNFENVYGIITIPKKSSSLHNIDLIKKDGNIWTFQITITDIDGTIHIYYSYIDIKNHIIEFEE